MSGSPGSARSWRSPVAENRRAKKRLKQFFASLILVGLLVTLGVLLAGTLQKQPPLQAILIEVPGQPPAATGTLSAPEPESEFLQQLGLFFEAQQASDKLILPPLHGTWQKVSSQFASLPATPASRFVYLRTVARTDNPLDPQPSPDTRCAWLWLGGSDWKSLPDLLRELQPNSLECQTLLLLELIDVPSDAMDVQLEAGLPRSTWEAICNSVSEHNALEGRIRVITACRAGERCWEQPSAVSESQATTIFQAGVREILQRGGRNARDLFDRLTKEVDTAVAETWRDKQTLTLLEPDNYAAATGKRRDWYFIEKPTRPSGSAEKSAGTATVIDSAGQAAGDAAEAGGITDSQKEQVAVADNELVGQLTERLQRLLSQQEKQRGVSDNHRQLWLQDQQLYSLCLQFAALDGKQADVQGLELQLKTLEAAVQRNSVVANPGLAGGLSEQLLQRLIFFATPIDEAQAGKLLNTLLSTPEYAGELALPPAQFLDWCLARLQSERIAAENRADELRRLSSLLSHPRWKAADAAVQMPVWWPLLKRISIDATTDQAWQQLQAFLRLERQRREICLVLAGYEPTAGELTPLPTEFLADTEWRRDSDGADRCERIAQWLTTAESWLGYAGFDGLRNLTECCDEAELLLVALRRSVGEQTGLLQTRRLQRNEAPWLLRYFAQTAVEQDILPIHLEQLKALAAPVTPDNFREFQRARADLRRTIQERAGSGQLTARHWRWLCRLPLWDLPQLENLRKNKPDFRPWTHSSDVTVGRIAAAATDPQFPRLQPPSPAVPANPPGTAANVGTDTAAAGVAGLRERFFALRTMLAWERDQLALELSGQRTEELRIWEKPLADACTALKGLRPADDELLQIPLPLRSEPGGGIALQPMGDEYEPATPGDGQLSLRRRGPPLAEARTLPLLLTAPVFPKLSIPVVLFRSDLIIQPRSEYAWTARFRTKPEAAPLEQLGTADTLRLPLRKVNAPLPLWVELEKTLGPSLKRASVRLRGLNRESSPKPSEWTEPLDVALGNSETGLQSGRLKFTLPKPLDVSDGLEIEITAIGADGNRSGSSVTLKVQPYLPLAEPTDAPTVRLVSAPTRLEITPPRTGSAFRILFSPQVASRISKDALQAKNPLKSYEFRDFPNWEPGAVYEVSAFWPPHQWLWDVSPDRIDGQREVSAEGQHVRMILSTPDGLQQVRLPGRIMVDEHSEYLFREAAPTAPPAVSGTVKLVPELQLFGFAEDNTTRKVVIRLIRIAKDREIEMDRFSRSFDSPCRQQIMLTSDDDGNGVLTAMAELWRWPERPLELVEPGRYRLTAEVTMDIEDSPILCQSSVDLIWDREPPADFKVQSKQQANGRPRFMIRNLEDLESGLECLSIRPGPEDSQNEIVRRFERDVQSRDEWEWSPNESEWKRLQELAVSQGGQLTLEFRLRDSVGHETDAVRVPVRFSSAASPAEQVPGPRSILVKLPPGGQWRVRLQQQGQQVVERMVGPQDSREVLFSGLVKATHTLQVQKSSDGTYSDYINRTIKDTEISDEGPLQIPVSN